MAEYRNHWADILAGYFTGGAIAVFLVRASVKMTICWEGKRGSGIRLHIKVLVYL